MVQQIHGKGMAKGVNQGTVGDLGPDPGFPVDAVEDVLDLAGGDPLAGVGVDEEGVVRRSRRCLGNRSLRSA